MADSDRMIGDAIRSAATVAEDASWPHTFAEAMSEGDRRRRLLGGRRGKELLAIVAVAAVVVALLIVPLPHFHLGGPEPGGPGNTTSPWKLEAKLGPALLGGPVSCATATDCYELSQTPLGTNARFLVSTDGGASWTLVATSLGDSFDQLSCPAPGDCYASTFILALSGTMPALPELAHTTDSGRTWSIVAIPSGFVPAHLSCRTALDCLVLGIQRTSEGTTRVLVTTDGGKTWSGSALPGSPLSEAAVCVSATSCYATAGGSGPYELFHSMSGGASWQLLWRFPADVQLVSVACPTGTECLVGGSIGAAGSERAYLSITRNGGASWGAIRVPSPWPVEALSCPSLSHCVALVGINESGGALVSDDGGSSWQAATLPSTAGVAQQALTCPSPQVCVAGGSSASQISAPGTLGTLGIGLTWSSSDGGKHWRITAQPAGTSATGIVCMTATECVMTGASANGTVVSAVTDDGVTWTDHAVPGVDWIGKPSCPSAGRCFAIAQSARGTILLSSSDGGVSWAIRHSFGDKIYAFTSQIDCPSTEACDVLFPNEISDQFRYSADGGLTWSAHFLQPYGTGALLVCTSARVCIVGERQYGNFLVTTDAGSTWQKVAVPSLLSVWALSCGTPTTCMAMVSVFKGHAAVLESVESVDGWHHWSVGAAPPVGVQSLSCAGASTCTLLGSGRIIAGQLIGRPLSYVTTDSGRSWVEQASVPILGSAGAWTTASCPTAAHCVAAGYGPDGSTDIFER
jgi:photosystem II stability/assembly factor-like uncharacterized protein